MKSLAVWAKMEDITVHFNCVRRVTKHGMASRGTTTRPIWTSKGSDASTVTNDSLRRFTASSTSSSMRAASLTFVIIQGAMSLSDRSQATSDTSRRITWGKLPMKKTAAMSRKKPLRDQLMKT